MKLTKLSKNSFLRSNGFKVYLADDPIVFGKIVGIDSEILIGWQSDLIEPTVVEIDDKLVIGCDCRLVIYDITNSRILITLALSSNFASFVYNEESLIVLSEVEILVLNRIGLSIKRHVHLPDVVENYEIKDGVFEVFCMDGRRIEIGSH